MANVSGIAIHIRAFLPTGKTIEQMHTALSLVKDAHATGDYSAVLAAAQIDDVKAEQKTRRIEDAPAEAPADTGDASGSAAVVDGGDAPDSTATDAYPLPDVPVDDVTAPSVGTYYNPDANAAEDEAAAPAFVKGRARKLG